MNYVCQYGQLLISIWIWTLTSGGYHLFINSFIMTLLFKFFLKSRLIPSILLSASSQLAAFLFFNFFVIVILNLCFGITYNIEQPWAYIPSYFSISLYLGLVYTILQNIFFVIINRYYKLHLSWVFLITFISNILTVTLIHLFIQKMA